MGSLPTLIGPYRVVRQLGEGGMGTVFEAVHEVIQRRVAIKVLHPEANRSADTVNRFINEARAVNLVDHPGLVQITDFGNLPDGSGYLVMEYLKGVTLSGRLERDGGKLSPSETVQIGIQIAAAVAAVHKKNIIHRDLKPSNVMLVPEPAMPTGERVKVLDFGLAKLSEAREAAVVKTNSQAVMGTPLYMSPEQCEGAGRVDAKSDVYSLGCMLYEMLSNRPPFSGDGPGQVMGQHLFKQPEPMLAVAPTIPSALANLVDRLLVKPREQRPSMRAVQKALEALAAELPPPPRRQEPEGSAAIDAQIVSRAMASTLGKAASETRQPRRRTLTYIGFAGVAVAATLTAALIWSLGSQRPVPPPVVMVSPVASPPKPPAPRQVTLRVVSQPPGAQLVDVADGKQLGTTPWQQEMPQSDEPLRVRLRMNGYTEQALILSRQRDDAAETNLVATPEPRRPQASNKPISPPRPAQKTPASPPARVNYAKPIFD